MHLARLARLLDWWKLHGAHRSLLFAPEPGEPVRESIILACQHGNREQCGVDRSSLTDREGRNRDASGHLHDGKQ